MAAPFAGVCFKTIANLHKARQIQRCLCVPVSQYSQAVTSLQSQDAGIRIPKKIKRDKLAILKALESTVEWDPRCPHYLYLDDPYLLPQNSEEQVLKALAMDYGMKAAQFAIHHCPEAIHVRPMEDLSYVQEGYRLKPEPVLSEDTLEGLEERIEMEETIKAHNSYTILLEKGVDVPPELTLSLLELLCFYNSMDPPTTPSPLFNYFSTVRAKKKATLAANLWRNDDLADELFQSLENPCQRAHAAMLRGCAKYRNYEGTTLYWAKMKQKHMKLGLAEFNALLAVFNTRKHIDMSIKGQRLYMKVMKEMEENGVAPDIETFDLILDTVGRANTKKISQDIFAEIKECGIEPSLTTYTLMLQNIIPRVGDTEKPLLWEIVKRLQGKQLVPTKLSDYQFFHEMMMRCNSNSDLELAHAIQDIVETGKNFRLLGSLQMQRKYFFNYLSVVILFDELDNVMEMWKKFVPHTFVPDLKLMQSLLRVVSLHSAFEHVPWLWSISKHLFSESDYGGVLACFLPLMCDSDADAEMQVKFLKIGKEIMNWFETTAPSKLTAIVLGQMCKICLNAGNIEQAWVYVDMNYTKRKSIEGFMRPETLRELADHLLKEKDVPKLLKVCTLLADSVSLLLHDVRNDIIDKLELSQQDRIFLNNLD